MHDTVHDDVIVDPIADDGPLRRHAAIVEAPEKGRILVDLVGKFPGSFSYTLEPETSVYKWLFQLDDSQSLHRKWLLHQTSIYKWLFGVPGLHE